MGDSTSHTRNRTRSRFLGTQCSAFAPGPIGLSTLVIDPLWRSGSFPNIRARSEALYEEAKRHYNAFLKVKSFEKTYAKIILALNDVSMHLDATSKLTFEFTNPKTLGTLISDAIASKVLDELKGQTIDALQEKLWMKKNQFGHEINRFKIFSAVLSHAMLLNEIYTDIDNKDLVNNQRGSRRKEARKKKVSFCIAALAAKETGSAMSDQFVRRRIHIWEKFHEFEEKQAAWLYWDTMEKKLAGTYHEEDRIGPANHHR